MKRMNLVVPALLLTLGTPMPVMAKEAKAAKAEGPTSLGNTAPVRISKVMLDSAPGVFVGDDDRQLILSKIQSRLNALSPSPAADAPAYRMSVILTRFSHGEAAARMALIGLGSIHVEGKVQLIGTDGKQVAEFVITKGLVLGGLAGGFATASSVEDRFANAVVATIIPRPSAAASSTEVKPGDTPAAPTSASGGTPPAGNAPAP